MSIMPRELARAETAETAAINMVCAGPECESRPNPLLRVPLCNDCARDAAFQYLALTQKSDHEEEAEANGPRTALDEEGTVYFVQLGNRIKIGFTRNLAGRMRAVPHEAVLATFPGTMRDEARCHAAFAHLRTNGEWFEADTELTNAIEDMRAATALARN